MMDARQETLLGAAAGRGARGQHAWNAGLRVLRTCGSCRCSPLASSACVAAVFVALFGGVMVAHWIHERGREPPPPPPPPLCGTWPLYIPCRMCAYGTMRPPHRVTASDTCDSIAQQYGVPQFDLLNRNRSLSCCEAPNISASDMIDFCRPPTVAEWRQAGHPRPLPPAGRMISSYVGSMVRPGTPQGLRRLPDSINVAYLAGVEDATNHDGNFSLGIAGHGRCGSLVDNCSAMVEPTTIWRGGDDATTPAAQRVWLGSMVPLYAHCGPQEQCNWAGGGLSAEEWGRNAAASLEKLILRYRLSGLDFNIEAGDHPSFGQYVCSLFKHLNQRMGPGLIYTLTPCCSMGPAYQQVFDQCPSNVSLMQVQTYGSWSSGCCAYMEFGYPKTIWSIGTASLSKSPQQLWDEVKAWHKAHPESKGLFSWTAETSSKCTPPFCAEAIAFAAQRRDEPEPGLLDCKC